MQCLNKAFGVFTSHECLTDEDGLRTCLKYAFSIFNFVNATFTNGDDALWNPRDETAGNLKVCGEAGEIAIIDADDPWIELHDTFEFGFLVDFKETVEPGLICRIVEILNFVILQGTDDNEDGTGSSLGSFKNLDGMDHEVLPEAWNRSMVIVDEV